MGAIIELLHMILYLILINDVVQFNSFHAVVLNIIVVNVIRSTLLSEF